MPELSSSAQRMSIPGMDAWLVSPTGRYVLEWEQLQFDRLVGDIFGYHAIQIGLPQADFLRANRIPLRCKAGDFGSVEVCCDPIALPFANASIDLVVLPHMLEFSQAPHQILREVERILIPEGRVLIAGFNPLSLWGLKQRIKENERFPWNGDYLSLSRLRDWLRLLGFDVERDTLGCYVPPVEQQQWLRRWRFLEGAGRRWWAFSGAIYLLQAIKRTPGMRLITPNWRNKPLRAKALRPLAQKESNGH